MKRDSKGRFCKTDEEGIKIVVGVPSIKKIIIWLIIVGILMPWISIIIRNNALQKLIEAFDELFQKSNEEQGTTKKTGLFS